MYYLPDELDNFRVPDVWTEYTSVGHTGGTSRGGFSGTAGRRRCHRLVETRVITISFHRDV